jgi:hypothetical protein
MKRGLTLIALFTVFLFIAIQPVHAFDFYGYTKHINGTIMANVNISLEIYRMPVWTPNATLRNISDANGFFNISVNDSLYGNSNWSFKPVLIKYNTSTEYAEYMGQSLPDLFYDEFASMSNITFYLKQAATIQLSGRGDSVHMFDNATDLVKNALPAALNYKSGLESINASGFQQWAFLNASDCIVFVNSAFTYNTSYCSLNITNATVFEQNPKDFSLYYIINRTQIQNCTLSGGTASCSTDEDVSGRSYSTVYGIEYYDIIDWLYVAATNAAGTILLDHYNISDGGIGYNDTESPDGVAAGNIQHYSNQLYIIGNNSETYQISKGFIQGDSIQWMDTRNYSQPNLVEGFAYSTFDSSWYYSYNLTVDNITKFEFESLYYDFNYQLKDIRLGYPIKENFQTGAVRNATLYMPADRNYSVMIYPTGGPSFPVKIDLYNIESGTSITSCNTTIAADLYMNCLNLNLTTDLVQVSGYAINNSAAADQNYYNFTILAYLLEAGDMVFKGASLPQGMGQWDNPQVTDTFNTTTGFYNFTLPAGALGSNFVLFAAARVNDSGTMVYLGGFRNTTLTYGMTPPEINFTIYPLIGNASNLGIGFDGVSTIPTKEKKFKAQNATGTPIQQAHVEIEVDYSDLSGVMTTFSWMVNHNNATGIFQVPLLNYAVKNVQVFSSQFAPRKTKFTASQLNAVEIVEINLTTFEPVDPDGNAFNDIDIMMYTSSAACSVPYPADACNPFGEKTNMSEFDPFKLVIGGGKLDFEIVKLENNITVKFIDVDLLASGPPDALFDNASSSSQAGSVVEEAWRFGSLGPEIYDYILIQVPYNASVVDENQNMYINITRFFDDDDFNVVLWDQTVNATAALAGTDYADYASATYISYVNGNGALCSASDITLSSSLCYKNTTTDMLWFKIPHFSGIYPEITGSVIGGGDPGNGGTTGGGGTSGGGKVTHTVTEEKFEAGYTKALSKGDTFKFNFSKEIHYVTVANVTSTTVLINVTSELQQAIMSIGDEKMFDLVGDGYYDLSVKLHNITALKQANITIMKIHELISDVIKEENCGNDQIDAGEDCSSCPADIKCGVGEDCVNGQCVAPSVSKWIVNQFEEGNFVIFFVISFIVVLIIAAVLVPPSIKKKSKKRFNFKVKKRKKRALKKKTKAKIQEEEIIPTLK